MIPNRSTVSRDGGLPPTVHWSLVGPEGGIDIWAAQSTIGVYGGVETHSRTPMNDYATEPDHTDCWLLKGPCWHDGAGLFFHESIRPRIDEYLAHPGVHPVIENMLWDWYDRAFGKEREQ